MKLTRLNALAVALLTLVPLPALAQFREPKDFTVTPAERKQVIDNSIAKLNEIYVFPETAKKMEQAIRARETKGEYSSITSAKQLSDKLVADLRDVSHDKHIFMIYDEAGAPPDQDDAPTEKDLAEQREFLKGINYGFEKVERLRSNIGYIDIRGFVPAAMGGETASAAMTFLANTDALIVDLRKNNGGEPAMIAYTLSYLFDSPTHLNDIYERATDKTQQWWTLPYVPGQHFGGKKPVYVLTSNRTFSGGEEFAYNIKTQKRGTLIGETTGGGAHPVRGLKVSDHFALGVPFARAINPITHTNWEGTGVTPDIAVPADEAFDKAYILVLENFLKATNDEGRKKDIMRLIDESKKK